MTKLSFAHAIVSSAGSLSAACTQVPLTASSPEQYTQIHILRILWGEEGEAGRGRGLARDQPLAYTLQRLLMTAGSVVRLT